MNFYFRFLIFWSGVGGATLCVYLLFKNIVGSPASAVVAVAHILTWTVPRPWRVVIPLAIVSELVAITVPLTMLLSAISPLLIWRLRGRVGVDLSFSYVALIALSAALGLAFLIVPTTFPRWQTIPWLSISAFWLACTAAILFGTLIVPSLHNRMLHGRYF